MITFGSLFSGVGGFDLGFERAGMQCAWQVEIDQKCRDILARHWPNVERYNDVRECGAHNLGAVDVICGGFPCQDLSVAGRRAGLAGERSGLWYEFHRVVAKLRPQWVVVENVPGLLSSNKGRDFATVLQGLVECGYGVCWRVLDAQYFGVAQRRRRVFIVGSLGDGRAAQVLFEREGGGGDTPPSREARQEVAGSLGGGSGERGWSNDLDRSGAFVAFAQNTRDEVRLQGGNGQISGALASEPGMKQTTYVAIAVNAHPTKRYDAESESFVFEPRFARNGRGAPSDIVPPLKAESGKTGRGDSAPVVATFDPRNVTSKANRTRCEPGLPSNTLHETGLSAIGNFGVRRLTPTECERLQGFPDGFTTGQADSNCYRQLGNAVCVPVVEWLGRRIVVQSAHPPSEVAYV